MFHSDMDRTAAAREWDFGGVDYMNHGSFGACPRKVKAFQRRERERLLRNPMDYLCGANAAHVTQSRLFWSGFVGADAENIVLRDCATQGVNTVMKSLLMRGYFSSGDEILITSHGYNACNNVVAEVAALAGAKVVVAEVPFPLTAAEEVTEAILAAVTGKTRLALIDHITSATALIFPIRDIVARLKERGIETLVDGAHAPAQVPLMLDELGAAFYTGNGHKWLCAAPGCAFLHVRKDFHDRIRPLVTSHGMNDQNPNVSPFQKAFAWTGTRDYTSMFTAKVAFDALSSLHEQGLPGLVADNARLVRYGYRLMLDMLGQKPHAPDDMTGTMATLLLPQGDDNRLRDYLRAKNFVTQVGQMPQLIGKARLIRLSAQAYNMPEQYERLVKVLSLWLRGKKVRDTALSGLRVFS